MLNALISGIVAALRGEFGDEIPIYTDLVYQGMTEPAFSVQIVKPVLEQYRGMRYLRRNLAAVYYFPKERGDYYETNSVIERMFPALEYISINGVLTRGTKPDAHVEDDVVVYTLNYDFFVWKTENEEVMEVLTIGERAEG